MKIDQGGALSLKRQSLGARELRWGDDPLVRFRSLSPDDRLQVEALRPWPSDPREDLPRGDYLELRAPRAPTRVARVVLGNELVDVGPDVQLLLDEPPLRALVVSLVPGRAIGPETGGTWLGVTFVDYTGTGDAGVLFFADPAAVSERTLILPVSGELVTTTFGEVLPEHARWWSDEGARALGARLASGV